MDPHRFSPWFHCTLAMSLLIAGSSMAVASPESFQLVEQGAAALERPDPDAALRFFTQAVAADPQDAQAVFLVGVALGRLGRYDEAVERLLESEKLGTKNPLLDFELGKALAGTMNFASATERLTRYEQKHPGNAAASFLLGRALVGLERYEEGETRLHEAIQRDWRFEPAARIYLAIAAADRGDEAAAELHLKTVISSPAGDDLSIRLRNEWAGLDDLGVGSRDSDHCCCCCGDDKWWDFFITMGGGYNSNVPLLPGTFPGGGALGESAFGMLGLGLNLNVLEDENRSLQVGYLMDLSGYEDPLSVVNSGQHYWHASYEQRLSDSLSATMLVDDRYTSLAGSALSNRVTARPGLCYYASENLRLAIQYEYAADDYSLILAPVLDRTGDNHNVILAAEYFEPRSETTLQGGYYHMIADTVGSDFDYDANAVFVSAMKMLPWCTTAQVRYVKSFVDFRNPNSFTGFTTARDDDLDLLSIVLTRPVELALAPDASVFLRFDYFNDNSNLPLYNYDMTVVGGGLTLEY